MCLCLSCLLLSLSAFGQGFQTHIWSSTSCDDCQGTLLYPGWYSDGSSLFGEGSTGKNIYAFAAVGEVEGGTAVALGFQLLHEPSTRIQLKQSVTLETDSSPNMVLFALAKRPRSVPPDSIASKKEFKGGFLTLRAGKPVGNFLFFPSDKNASHVTVVITIGSETFRFPFARDPNAHAKFGDPDALPANAVSQKTKDSSLSVPDIRSDPSKPFTGPQSAAPVDPRTPTGASSGQMNIEPTNSKDCRKNISFAVASGGSVVSRVPAFC